MIPTDLSQIIAGFLLALAGWLVRHFLGTPAPKSTDQPASTANLLQQLHRDATTQHELKLVQTALNSRLGEPGVS
jgi:1,6-anhydro-N-acetylmuramate kinase